MEDTSAISEQKTNNDGETRGNNTKDGASFFGRQFWLFEPDLMPFKSFYFSGSGAIGALMPMISLYFKQIGFSPNQIGLISGLRPIVAFFFSPFCGTIAGRFKISKILLMIGLVGWVSIFMGIGLIPPPAITSEHCRHGDNSMNTTRRQIPVVNSDITVHKGVSYKEALLESRSWMFHQSDVSRVFITVLTLTIFGEIVLTPTHALSDSGCLEYLGKENIHKYGTQRCWGALGFGMFSLISGSVVSTTRRTVTVCGIDVVMSDYRLAFYIFAALVGLAFIAAIFFKFPNENQETDKTPDVKSAFTIFMSMHYGSWLICIVFMGLCNGVIWGFLNWHLENLGATQLLIGIAGIINSTAEIVMFAVIFFILNKVGHGNLLFVGLLGYVIRFCAYGLMTNPWVVLPFEMLQGFTFAGVWSAQMGYLCTAVPMDSIPTMQGILHGMYWGLGSGSGFMLGGLLVQRFGARVTFLAMAIGSLINLIMFFILQKLFKKPDVKETYEELHN